MIPLIFQACSATSTAHNSSTTISSPPITCPPFVKKAWKSSLPAGLLRSWPFDVKPSRLLILVLTFSKLQSSTYYNVTPHMAAFELIILFLCLRTPDLMLKLDYYGTYFSLNAVPFSQAKELQSSILSLFSSPSLTMYKEIPLLLLLAFSFHHSGSNTVNHFLRCHHTLSVLL